MQRQTDITPNMRTILVDWLVEVADEYHLHRETLFLAVNFVDRFLSVMAVQRSKLQLVGTSAMFIAAYVYTFRLTVFSTVGLQWRRHSAGSISLGSVVGHSLCNTRKGGRSG